MEFKLIIYRSYIDWIPHQPGRMADQEKGQEFVIGIYISGEARRSIHLKRHRACGQTVLQNLGKGKDFPQKKFPFSFLPDPSEGRTILTNPKHFLCCIHLVYVVVTEKCLLPLIENPFLQSNTSGIIYLFHFLQPFLIVCDVASCLYLGSILPVPVKKSEKYC